MPLLPCLASLLNLLIHLFQKLGFMLSKRKYECVKKILMLCWSTDASAIFFGFLSTYKYILCVLLLNVFLTT